MRVALRRIAFYFAIAVCFAVACSDLRAAMILIYDGPTPLPGGELDSYTLRAVATAGENINSFENPSVTVVHGLGAHQVWAPVTNSQTSTRQDQLTLTPALWSDSWLPYDTYFFPSAANSLRVGAGAITETKSGQGAVLTQDGTLGVPNTGFGPISTQGGGVTYGYTAASGLPGSSVAIMQLVQRIQDANLVTLSIVNSSGGITATSIVVSRIPEPGTCALLMGAASMVSVVRKQRRKF